VGEVRIRALGVPIKVYHPYNHKTVSRCQGCPPPLSLMLRHKTNFQSSWRPYSTSVLLSFCRYYYVNILYVSLGFSDSLQIVIVIFAVVYTCKKDTILCFFEADSDVRQHSPSINLIVMPFIKDSFELLDPYDGWLYFLMGSTIRNYF